MMMLNKPIGAPNRSVLGERSCVVRVGPGVTAQADGKGLLPNIGAARKRAYTSSTKAVLEKNSAATEQTEVHPSGPYCSIPSAELRRAPLFQRVLCYCGIACPVEYEYEAPRQWAARGWVTEEVTPSGLTPEVEQLAYFTDGPGSPIEQSHECQGPLWWWRYQGPGL